MPNVPAHVTVLDACTVVNLYATRRMEDILSTVDGDVAVVDVVEREAQYVLRGDNGEDAREREPIDLRQCIALGVLSVIGAAGEDELLTYIDLTQQLDDGEAMTAALAIHRNFTVVTDDRKAIRILTNHSVPVLTTLDLIKMWADRHRIEVEMLRTALINLVERGNYAPSRSHSLKVWWDAAMNARDPGKG